MKTKTIMYVLIAIFIGMTFVMIQGCSNVTGVTDVAMMEVEFIYYAVDNPTIDMDVYYLKYKCELYKFVGCPLEPAPKVGDKVAIDLNNMKWIKIIYY